MLYLFLCILSSTLIYLSFKLQDKFNANLSGTIIINYLTATILGIIINPTSFSLQQTIHASWLPIAATIGFLFVVMFFLIGKSTQKTGIALTTIATRMSMVIPIFYSLLFFEESFSTSKLIKIAITIIAVILAIWHKPEKNIRPIYAFLPLILFIGSGSVDSLVKAAQYHFVPENEIQLFSSSLFAVSFVTSFTLLLNKKNRHKIVTKSTLLLGIALGAFNFGSLYFLMNALNKSGIDSSLVFGINNLSIVCLSLIIGYIFFKEKLTKLNWIGVLISIISIFILIRF